MLSRTSYHVSSSSPLVGVALALSSLLVTGCDEPEVVDPGVEIVEKGSQALVAGDLESVNGTYGAGCTNRSGSWSIEIANGATLDHSALSVVKNDTGCVLTLTELHAESVLYVTAQDIALSDAVVGSASTFKLSTAADTGDPAIFFANAKINPDDFSSDFVLTFLYSDDPNSASGTNNADYDNWESSVAGDSVSAPNYTYADNLVIETDVNDVVTTTSGSLDFTDGSVTGEHYLVDLGTLPGSPTYDDIKDAFDGGSPTAIGGANPSIPVATFDLTGDTLPQTRTVLIRHVENNVPSFQVLKVTFAAP